MSQLYKRMLLIRPDVLEKYQKGASASSSSTPPLSTHLHQERDEDMWEDDGPQVAYMRRELLKDSLSPIAPTVDVLGHLQKEMARMLKDPTMDTEEKLATYNDLMTRSQILTSKAKAMATEPYTHDIAFHAHDQAAHETDREDTLPEKRPIAVRQKTPKKDSAFIPEALLRELDKIPLSYRKTAKKLYTALNSVKGSGHSPHFSKSGCMILEGNVQLNEPTLAQLLTTAVRPAIVKRADLPHQREFLRVVKKINPKLRYLRNKTLEYDPSPTPQQAGDGFMKKKRPFVLKWSTRL